VTDLRAQAGQQVKREATDVNLAMSTSARNPARVFVLADTKESRPQRLALEFGLDPRGAECGRSACCTAPASAQSRSACFSE
jgi:hypothetical protein